MNPVQFFTAGSWLNWLAWGLLAAVPPAIILLYFLKLKRQPLEVPSTYLWTKSIEDLHVNTIWQRLRQSLLLFLQLLLIALLLIACLWPNWRSSKLVGNRFVFLIDNSASMSATDVEPTRLREAQKRALEYIQRMESGDAAMIVSFADGAQVEQPFTESRRLLRDAVNRIQPSNRTSDLYEALRAAAGLANPGYTRLAGTDPIDDSMPATVYILSDGGFPLVSSFSLGHLEPVYLPIGRLRTPDGQGGPRNVGITSFTCERNPERPDKLQAFARLENYSAEDLTVLVDLYLDGALLDASEVTVPADGASGTEFNLQAIETGALMLRIEQEDELLLDNVAYAAVNMPRRVRVLVVTSGNDALQIALETEEAVKLAQVTFAAPESLEEKALQDQTAGGAYDLIIYDRCAPREMPQANTLFIGAAPPQPGWALSEAVEQVFIVDTDKVHPLTQLIDMTEVKYILDGRAVEAPTGSRVLMDSQKGAIFRLGARQGYEDAVLGFTIVDTDENGGLEPKTDWPIRRSFPVFMMNVVKYLGGSRDTLAVPSIQPGVPIRLRTDAPVDVVDVRSPANRSVEVPRNHENAFVFIGTDELGIYQMHEGGAEQPTQQFAVNIFDSRESNIVPQPAVEIGYKPIEGQTRVEPGRQEIWKWFLLLGLVVLVFEWYVYNRRVYL